MASKRSNRVMIKRRCTSEQKTTVSTRRSSSNHPRVESNDTLTEPQQLVDARKPGAAQAYDAYVRAAVAFKTRQPCWHEFWHEAIGPCGLIEAGRMPHDRRD
jgi:hypothetical protein